LPSLALSTQGGGPIAINPANTQKPQALYNIFQFDITPTQPVPDAAAGGRVYVKFDHGAEPIAWRILRATQQTFLSHLHI
jgi:putative peptide zinc metalloprotease protein